jgi:NAD kinase
MRATLFHNPTAGHKIDKDDILAAMKLADFDTHYVSVKNGNVGKALEKKADLIVIAGGDGTIAEVLIQIPDRSVPVAIFPLGTATFRLRFFRSAQRIILRARLASPALRKNWWKPGKSITRIRSMSDW